MGADSDGWRSKRWAGATRPTRHGTALTDLAAARRATEATRSSHPCSPSLRPSTFLKLPGAGATGRIRWREGREGTAELGRKWNCGRRDLKRQRRACSRRHGADRVLVWFGLLGPGPAGRRGAQRGRERSTGRRQLDKQNTGGVAGLRGRRPDPTRPDLRPKFQGGAGGFSQPKCCCCPCREGEELVNYNNNISKLYLYFSTAL